MKPIRRIFTRSPSLWERIGMAHPALQACVLVFGLFCLMALAEPIALGIECLLAVTR